jgi:hypothetical protein
MTIPDLLVNLVDDEIIVTLPGTSYTVTFYKPADPRNSSPRASRSRTIAAPL